MGKAKKAEPLSPLPQNIDDFNWYYEERGHVTLVHEVRERTTGEYIRTDQIEIPWPKLLRSVCRKYGLWIKNRSRN